MASTAGRPARTSSTPSSWGPARPCSAPRRSESRAAGAASPLRRRDRELPRLPRVVPEPRQRPRLARGESGLPRLLRRGALAVRPGALLTAAETRLSAAGAAGRVTRAPSARACAVSMSVARWSALALAALVHGPPAAAAADAGRPFPQRGEEHASAEQVRVDELLDLAQRLRARADALRDRADELRGAGKPELAQGLDDRADGLAVRADDLENRAEEMRQALAEKTGGHRRPHRPARPSKQRRAP